MFNELNTPKTAQDVMKETLMARLRQSWDRAERELDKLGR